MVRVISLVFGVFRFWLRAWRAAACGGWLSAWLCLRWQADRFNINSQLEHLQMKYVGTGHADASKLCGGAPRSLSPRTFGFVCACACVCVCV